jgi:hypothetical protein
MIQVDCPYCHVQTECEYNSEYQLRNDEDWIEHNCNHCEKTFVIQMQINFTTKCYKDLME